MKVTLSIIKADVGGYVGHSDVHPALLARTDEALAEAKEKGLIIDYCRAKCGDDIALIMTHTKGTDNEDIHHFAWDTFEAVTEVAKEYGMYGAGQDLLSDAFSGNLRGMGPGYAEMTFLERASEPVIVFLADKTEPGAPHSFGIRRVRSRSDATVAAAPSTQRLSLIAGRYVGKDDPVLIVRCQ